MWLAAAVAVAAAEASPSPTCCACLKSFVWLGVRRSDSSPRPRTTTSWSAAWLEALWRCVSLDRPR